MHRLPRRVAACLPLVVFSLLVLAATPASAESPIHPSNRPTPLAGQENGYVSPDQLVTVVPGCRVARAAAPSLRLLLSTARSRGEGLYARDCYRPVAGQVEAQQSATTKGNSACAAMPQTYPDGRPKGTSMHGWGKAVDFGEAGARLTFESRSYRFLKETAGRFGWNHPGWAEPGGSACPEPWHWEWVGDGGTMGLDSIRADVVALIGAPGDAGYGVVTGLGAVRHHGASADRGSMGDRPINWVVVGATATPSRTGYWLTAADGGVFTFGDAGFHGSTGDIRLNQPIVGMASSPSGRGYWLVAADGGIFTFGDAEFFGSTGAMRLNKPVVGMAATPTGKGYWLVASDGGMFSFGDAAFHGSTGDIRLNQPVTAMTPTPSGGGYFLTASDGGMFTFGDARYHGSGADRPLAQPVVGMALTARGDGSWLVTADGTVLNLGAARHFGNG